jgi:hypothetical protein
MTSREKVRRMVGRTIVKAEPRAERDEAGMWFHQWRLTLDDGTMLSFVTEETCEGVVYGTDIIVTMGK